MNFLAVLVTFCCVYRVADAFGLHGFHFRGLEDPESYMLNKSEIVTEEWITQPLDHFNHRENRTWSMRYLENSGHFEKNGSIFIMIGGEWAISPGYLQTGIMYELAVAHKGMMYYTEHRYYGQSKPTEDTSTENLQYLNVDQALADLAYFIEDKKKKEEFKNSQVFVFGGSYAGNMAAWARLKYPHLIQGALASSAPVFAKADFYEYYEVVTRSLGRHSLQCVKDIEAAFDAVEELLSAKGGPEQLKTYFNLCDLPDTSSPSDLGYFMDLLAEQFAGIVQYERVANGESMIEACCKDMTDSSLGSPMQRLARLVSSKDECLDNSYESFLKTYRNASWDSDAGVMRQWYHQTCTEYGYYQTTNSDKSIFGTLFPLSYFTDLCKDLYDTRYNGEFLNERIKRTNIMYGGRTPDLTNVIFTNGDVDPWHALSILEDLNESSPAILIEGSSHCLDLKSDADTDVAGLPKARAKVREIIGGWIRS